MTFAIGIDARAFGVKADAATDNAAALQSAISAAIAASQPLLLPAGEIHFGTGLQIDGPIHIKGVGGTRRWRFSTSGTRLVFTGTGDAITVNNDVLNDVVDGVTFEAFELSNNGSGTDGIVLDAANNDILAIEGTRLIDVLIRDFGQDGLSCKGTVFDVVAHRSSFIGNTRYGIVTDDTGAKAGGPSQYRFVDCFAASGTAASSWCAMLDGESMEWRGGTVAGSTSGNGLWLAGQALIAGANIEGVSTASTVGVRYSGTKLVCQALINSWDIGLQIGNPSAASNAARDWTVDGDISGSTTDLHVVAGGVRSTGVIINHGRANTFTVVDDRDTTDGVHSDWIYLSGKFQTQLGHAMRPTTAGQIEFSDGFNTDTIREKTSGVGVTVDGLLLKDGGIGAAATHTGKQTFSGEVEIDGALNHDGSTAGFYGATPVTKAGSTADIKDALVALGLITDSGATPLNLDGGKLTADEAEIDGALNHDGSTAGFYGTEPVAQPAYIADASGGAVIDSQARAAVNAVIAALETLGLVASS